MRYGYFDDANREYVIERPDVPVSWTNYLGREDMCTVLSHNAGGYSFYKSAERGRITRFRPNAVPLDRPGHYVYLRDDDNGDYWSISWQPVGKDLKKAKYQVRHGLSYSKFFCRYRQLQAEQIMFIPLGNDVELWDVRIKNTAKHPRKISVFSYVEFSLHRVELDSQDFQMGLYAGGTSYKDGIIDYDFFYTPGLHHFLASSFTPDSFDCLRDDFLGAYNTETNPLALQRGKCSNSQAQTGNHCGSLHRRLTLKPGEEKRVVFMLGVGAREKTGRKIKKKYSDFTQVDKSFDELRRHWQEKLSALQCQTPDPGMNSMINIWTLYQAQTCVTWSRFASFIEVGGRTGLGYRDTAQDAMSVIHIDPDKCRQRLIELLHGQNSTGFALHLFDPLLLMPSQTDTHDSALPTVIPTVKTRRPGSPCPAILPTKKNDLSDVCADDALWLIATVCEYVKETGDLAFFDKVVPFEDKGRASVYEHLKRALDFSALHVGKTGICLGLRADWNDCINLRGGESAMTSFIHLWALNVFLEAAQFLDRKKDVRKYHNIAQNVKKACNKHLWDEKWFIRGITAKGKKLGTLRDRRGKLFLNAQTWAVISGLADDQKGRMCMDAVNKHLYCPYGLHLLWPAFDKPDDDIGFVTRVYKGIKENASIFTHPNPWAVIAECILGRGDRAFKFYQAMNPYNQNDDIEHRLAEPYSYCQFIAGKDHAHFGRAYHPWLTGSAGWFYTAATQYLLGVRLTFDGLVIDPCIPRSWDGFTVRRKWRQTTFDITVKNPKNISRGVKSVTLNGKPAAFPLPPQKKNSRHQLEITMG
jgi:N,N'-diacetylchitobiose phosphorylase